jgi:hypothetical protein
MYVNWYPFGEAYTALGCVNMVPPYGWETRDCAYAMPYVCERY